MQVETLSGYSFPAVKPDGPIWERVSGNDRCEHGNIVGGRLAASPNRRKP
jgi:hypothetical protein